MFLQIRIKSIGSEHQLDHDCPHCKKINNIHIDLNEAQLVRPAEVDPKVELSDGVGIVMKIPNIDEAIKISDDFTQAIISCIDTIYDKDNVYNKSDVSNKELIEFVESFGRPHVEKVEKFITSQPSIQYMNKFDCSHCNESFDVHLYGLQDFFS
jgi:hypothetical protein